MRDVIKLRTGEAVTVETEEDEDGFFVTWISGPGMTHRDKTSSSPFIAAENHRRCVEALKRI